MSRRTNLAPALPEPHRSTGLRGLALVVRDRVLHPIASDHSEIIGSVLKGLPGIDREIMRLYYGEKQTTAEIGKALDLSEDKVHKIKTAATRRLRKAFDTNKTTPAKPSGSVIVHAIAVFGDERKASHWLGSPLRLLGGRSPAQALAEDGDISAVDRILTRIEHNVPS